MGRTCLGIAEGQACVFGKEGAPAHPKPGNERCSWCDPGLLEEVATDPKRRGRLIFVFRNFNQEVLPQALSRLPAAARPVFEEARKRENPSSSTASEPCKRPASAEIEESPAKAKAKAAPALKRPAAALKHPAGQAPDPPANEPPAAAPAIVRQIDLAAFPEIADAQDALLAFAKAVAPQLRPHWIAGDGKCLYRSVALQMPAGEDHPPPWPSTAQCSSRRRATGPLRPVFCRPDSRSRASLGARHARR